MLKTARVGLLALVFVAAAGQGVSFAARGGPGGPMFKGGWHPKVGSGAVYRIEQSGQPAMDWEVAVVGQEAGAYWLEMRMTMPEEMIMKTLVAPGEVKRTIIKSGREPAMELPGMSMGQSVPETDIDKSAKLIGKESVTTPAGTFSCDHYQTQGSGSVADVWVAPQVSPYGLVKMTSPGTTMVLSKLVSGAKTRITETPQKLEIPDMPGMEEMMKQMQEQRQ